MNMLESCGSLWSVPPATTDLISHVDWQMNPAFPQDATWPDNDLLKFWQTPESDQSNNSGGEFGQGVQDNMRTIYFGNLPQHITLQLLLDHVNGGIVERVKLFVERRCAFVTFLHATEAARVFSDTQNRKIAIGGMETRVGWGNPITRAAHILQAANQGATRHVLIGNLDAEYLTVSALAAVFSAYGQLDTISIMPDTNVASVHFASIYSAIKAVGDLCSQHTWANCTITYGDDRCTIPVSDVSPPLLSNIALPNTEISRRTVYIGSIHPDAAVIRGGLLQNIRYLPLKNIAFVMFVDSQAAEAFHDRVSECGLLIKGKRIKIGWGKSVPLPPIVSAAIQESGSRNVYIGGINSSITQERLSADFSPFGEIELINIVQDKSIAFVSFTDIISAINAIEGIKRNPSYASLKINYGKDRCANPPRIQRDMSASSWAANNYGIDRVADLLFETGISDSMFPM